MSETNKAMADELMKNVNSKSAKALYLMVSDLGTNVSIVDDRVRFLSDKIDALTKENKQLKGMVGDLIQHQKAVEKYLERINSQLSVDPEPEVIQADSFLKEAALETISAHEIFAKDTADGFERLEAMMIWKYIRDAVEGR